MTKTTQKFERLTISQQFSKITASWKCPENWHFLSKYYKKVYKFSETFTNMTSSGISPSTSNKNLDTQTCIQLSKLFNMSKNTETKHEKFNGLGNKRKTNQDKIVIKSILTC